MTPCALQERSPFAQGRRKYTPRTHVYCRRANRKAKQTRTYMLHARSKCCIMHHSLYKQSPQRPVDAETRTTLKTKGRMLGVRRPSSATGYRTEHGEHGGETPRRGPLAREKKRRGRYARRSWIRLYFMTRLLAPIVLECVALLRVLSKTPLYTAVVPTPLLSKL